MDELQSRYVELVAAKYRAAFDNTSTNDDTESYSDDDFEKDEMDIMPATVAAVVKHDMVMLGADVQSPSDKSEVQTVNAENEIDRLIRTVTPAQPHVVETVTPAVISHHTIAPLITDLSSDDSSSTVSPVSEQQPGVTSVTAAAAQLQQTSALPAVSQPAVHVNSTSSSGVARPTDQQSAKDNDIRELEQVINDVSIHSDSSKQVSPVSSGDHIDSTTIVAAPTTQHDQPQMTDTATVVPQPASLARQTSMEADVPVNNTMSSFHVQRNSVIHQPPIAAINTTSHNIDRTVHKSPSKHKHVTPALVQRVPQLLLPSSSLTSLPKRNGDTELPQTSMVTTAPPPQLGHATLLNVTGSTPYASDMTLQQKLQHLAALSQANKLTQVDDSLQDVVTDTSHTMSVVDEYELLTGDLSVTADESLYTQNATYDGQMFTTTHQQQHRTIHDVQMNVSQSGQISPSRIRHTRIFTKQRSTTTSPRHRVPPQAQTQTQSQPHVQPLYVATQQPAAEQRTNRSVWSDAASYRAQPQPYQPQQYEQYDHGVAASAAQHSSVWSTGNPNEQVRLRSRASNSYMHQRPSAQHPAVNQSYINTTVPATRAVNLHTTQQLYQPKPSHTTHQLPVQPLRAQNVAIALAAPHDAVHVNREVSRLICATDDIKYIQDSQTKHQLWIEAVAKHRRSSSTDPAYAAMRIQPLNIDAIARHWRNEHMAAKQLPVSHINETAINQSVMEPTVVFDGTGSMMSPIKAAKQSSDSTSMTPERRTQLLADAEHIADALLGIGDTDLDDKRLLQHAIQLNEQLKHNVPTSQPHKHVSGAAGQTIGGAIQAAEVVHQHDHTHNHAQQPLPSNTAQHTQLADQLDMVPTQLKNLHAHKPKPARPTRFVPDFKTTQQLAAAATQPANNTQTLPPVSQPAHDDEIERYKQQMQAVLENRQVGTTRANTLLLLQPSTLSKPVDDTMYNMTQTRTPAMQLAKQMHDAVAAVPLKPVTSYNDAALTAEVSKLDAELHALNVTAQLATRQFGLQHVDDRQKSATQQSVDSTGSSSTTGLSGIEDNDLYVSTPQQPSRLQQPRFKAAAQSQLPADSNIAVSNSRQSPPTHPRASSASGIPIRRAPIVHSPIHKQATPATGVPAGSRSLKGVLKSTLSTSASPAGTAVPAKSNVSKQLTALKSKPRPASAKLNTSVSAVNTKKSPAAAPGPFKLNLGLANVKQSVEEMTKQGRVSNRYNNVDDDTEFEL